LLAALLVLSLDPLRGSLNPTLPTVDPLLSVKF